MDHTFQLRQNMNEEQLEEFAQNSLQKEMALEDYEKKKRSVYADECRAASESVQERLC